MDYQTLLERIYKETQHIYVNGKTADYIPALAQVNPKQYGISISMLDKQRYHIGDAHTPFSIQSISKVFGFALAYQQLGQEIWTRIGK